jgi:hypothetical protein
MVEGMAREVTTWGMGDWVIFSYCSAEISRLIAVTPFFFLSLYHENFTTQEKTVAFWENRRYNRRKSEGGIKNE